MADEARRLLRLRQQQQRSAAAAAPVLSQGAQWGRVNKLGQVFCTACAVVLKDTALWDAHLASRKHREAVAAHGGRARNTPPPPPVAAAAPDSAKRRKVEEGAPSDLPADFFDEAPSPPAAPPATVAPPPAQPTSKAAEESVGPQGLPVGFFDDAALDRKAQETLDEDRLQAEMDLFKQELQKEEFTEQDTAEEADDLGETEIFEQVEEEQERDLASRVEALRRRREEVAARAAQAAAAKQDVEEDDDEVDESAVADLMDWRARKTL